MTVNTNMAFLRKYYWLNKPNWEKGIVVLIGKYGLRRRGKNGEDYSHLTDDIFRWEDAAINGIVRGNEIVKASWDFSIVDAQQKVLLQQKFNKFNTYTKTFKEIKLIITCDIIQRNKNSEAYGVKTLTKTTTASSLNRSFNEEILIVCFTDKDGKMDTKAIAQKDTISKRFNSSDYY